MHANAIHRWSDFLKFLNYLISGRSFVKRMKGKGFLFKYFSIIFYYYFLSQGHVQHAESCRQKNKTGNDIIERTPVDPRHHVCQVQ